MQKYQSIIETENTIEQLEKLAKLHPNEVTFSTSFGIEDQVITHMISANNIPITIFTLDTGRLFPETYKVWEQTIQKYNAQIIPYYPDTAQMEVLLKTKGPNSFYQSIDNRKECCQIRKVDPLKRALQNTKVWITGLRAEQSKARSNLQFFEQDHAFKLVKFNPLKDWTYQQCKEYIKSENIPYNKLHDTGYLSIGCQPCTRPIKPDEDFRAGRWWWEKSSKECGLHSARPTTQIINIKKIQ